MAKPKKVLIVMASPRRRGNSTLLAEEAAQGALAAGAEVETVRLSELLFGPCRACEACRKAGAKGCVQNDDLKALHPAIRSADALLLASPIYWFTMSGQVKLFMDRLYVFGAKSYRELKDKRIGIILASGDKRARESGALNAMRSFKDAFAYLGAPIAGMIHAGGGRAGSVTENKALMKKAFRLGQSLAAR